MDMMNLLRGLWDRLAAWAAVILGALALLLGWIGVSGTEYPAEQIPYVVSGGLVGIFLLGLGGVLWLSADLQDEWRKLDEISQRLDALAPAAADDVAGEPEEPVPAGANDTGRRRAKTATSRT